MSPACWVQVFPVSPTLIGTGAVPAVVVNGALLLARAMIAAPGAPGTPLIPLMPLAPAGPEVPRNVTVVAAQRTRTVVVFFFFFFFFLAACLAGLCAAWAA